MSALRVIDTAFPIMRRKVSPIPMGLDMASRYVTRYCRLFSTRGGGKEVDCDDSLDIDSPHEGPV